ncbi:hypothetical protein LA76x_3728 [Lysobacter antibioticus]|uniref:Uncharacterized protein n=1 Tax=Lysobacter antibioticus TaxID=84531 RepID=A0A0S2FE96_LYSAN|nr:hypothetical protein LA76x_3728 [Lysobacter antibioticus]
MSYRKTAHVLCAALRVYGCIASSELPPSFHVNVNGNG